MRDIGADREQAAPTQIGLRMATSLRELQRAFGDRYIDHNLLPAAVHLEAGGSLDPAAYSAYFSIVRSIGTDQAAAALAPQFSLLANSIRPQHAPIEIKMLGAKDFGTAGVREVRRNFASASLKISQMMTIPADAEDKIRRKLVSALGLIRSKAPRAWTDLSRITTEIVATLGIARNGLTFDGCSSIERFGSILVNMHRKRTRLLLAETLVHESAHSLLFALSCNDHRVLNPRSEVHKSPLRLDPRPLDGIYHAVFVLARMHAFLSEIALNPTTGPRMQTEARKLVSVRHRNFLDGHAVLAAHAQLTPIGRELLDDAFARVETAAKAVSAAFPERRLHATS